MKIALPGLQPEQDYSCVPACIRIVFQYLGKDFSETTISLACKTTPRGTDQNLAARGIVALGFNAIKMENISFDDMTSYLLKGQPVIAFLSVKHLPYGGQVGMHAVVINGFDDGYVSYIDPARGEEIEINLETFIAAWDERGRLSLVIEPS